MTLTATGSSALLDVEDRGDAGIEDSERPLRGSDMRTHRVAVQQELHSGADSSGYMVAVE